MPVAGFFAILIILRLLFSDEPNYKGGRDQIGDLVTRTEKSWANKCDKLAQYEPKK